MTHDEEHTPPSEHIVEVPPRGPSQRAPSRRSIASISVALCLALAGLAIAVGIVRGQRATADARTRDAVQREELKDGWSTLSALAAQHSPSVTAPAAPQPTERNVVIVNVPPPVATSAAVVAPQVVAPTASAPVSAAAAPATPSAAPVAESAAAQTASSAAPIVPNSSYSADSVLCGPNTCNSGMVCCNPSCGICTAPGATCDTSLCSNPITYPASQSCGLSTCNIDSVCCNVSCGICTAPGESCSQRACG
ncbi:MAG: hypothetical protein ABW061_08625 [Polyangiaceae bacterium]